MDTCRRVAAGGSFLRWAITHTLMTGEGARVNNAYTEEQINLWMNNRIKSLEQDMYGYKLQNRLVVLSLCEISIRVYQKEIAKRQEATWHTTIFAPDNAVFLRVNTKYTQIITIKV